MEALSQNLQKKEPKGKLKVYFGAAPGVGKTYSLLQDAQSQRNQGSDIVVGALDTHGQPDLETLLSGFEKLPSTTGFNLDEALQRHPQLILMDEMEHANPPGSTHAKRWQDIKELLDRGIDVWTTLNVQSIESLNDVISQITRIHVKDTVPDFMLEQADTIKLVDLSPDDLIKRLVEGKIYLPGLIDAEKQNFFRKGNLAALRELALRVTAERVDAQIMHYRHNLGIKHVWPARERILVCVGPGYKSPKIIRAARRMATRLQTEWIAVNVQTPRIELSQEARSRAIENLRLAEQLGAEIQTIRGIDIVKEILQFARERNVTRIIIAKGIRSRWKDIFFGSLVEELVRKSGEIDIYIIHEQISKGKKAPPVPKTTQKTPYIYYLFSLLMVAGATLLNLLLKDILEPSNLIMIYLLTIVLISIIGQLGPAVLGLIATVAAYYFIFSVHSYTTLQIFQTGFTLFFIFFIGLCMSQLMVLGKKAQNIEITKSYNSTLHTLTRQLASTRGIDKLLMIAARFLAEIFDSEVIILLEENNELMIRYRYQSTQLLNSKDLNIAQWTYELGQMAGLSTNTSNASDSLFIPLLGTHGSLGVIKLRPRNPQKLLTPEKMHFIEACANQIALAIEVDHLHEQSRRSELKLESDEARKVLLQAVSHDLRTPVISIMGAASTLIEMGHQPDTKQVHSLSNKIYYEADQLNRLINNLLQITYLEAHSVKLDKELSSLKHVIETVANTLHRELGNREIEINIPNDLPFVPFDKVLIEQVFEDLIDNAIKFTPHETPIRISAKLEALSVLVTIEDEGPGIMTDEIDRLFEKFYRGRNLTTERGLGLGLALCYIIIKAHGGNIWAENRIGGGTSFKFTLPL